MATLRYHRAICSQAVAADLNKRHWEVVSSGSKTESLPSASLFGLTSWGETERPPGWSGDLLFPGGTFKAGSVPDEFEKQLLADWTKPGAKNRDDETAERNGLIGQFAYYKAIRATMDRCAWCHTGAAAGADVHVGGLIAVAKVKTPQ